MALPVLLICGCPPGNDGQGEDNGLTLTVTVSPAQAGTVARSPDSPSYTSGQTVTLTATPAPGFRFDHWQGDATGTANPLQIEMAASLTIQAVFILTDPTQTETSGATTVLPESITATAQDATHVRLSGANLPALLPGQILVGVPGANLIRIRSVAPATDGSLVEFEPAALTDVFKKTHIAINTEGMTTAGRLIRATDVAGAPVTPRTIRAMDFDVEDGTLVVDLSGLEIKLGDSCTVTLTNGALTLEPDFDFLLDIDDFSVERFKLVTTGTAGLDVDVEVEATQATGLLEKEITLAEADLFRGFVPAGPVIIEYVFFAKVKLGAKAQIGEAGTVTGGFDATASLSAGAEYANGRWQPIGSFDFEANPHMPGMTLRPAQIEVYAEPELGVKLYEIAGPSISFKDYVRLVSDYRHELVGLELHKGSEVSLNFELSVPKIDLATIRYSTTLFDRSYVMLARLAFAQEPTAWADLSHSPAGWQGSDLFWYTHPVTVTAAPTSGHRVAGYAIDYLCKDQSLTKSGSSVLGDEPVDGSKRITARLVPLVDGDDWEGSGGYTEPGPCTITTEVWPPEAGSIVVFPSRTGYHNGEKVLLEARKNSGFRFHHWEGAVSGTANGVQMSVSGDKTVRAVFESVVPRLLRVPQDYGTIQEALDAATYGDQVNLDFGTFSGNGNRDLDFHGRHVKIHGKGVANTIIDLEGSATAPHRLAELYDVPGCVWFTELTVRNGYAGTSRRVGSPNYVGGAIMCSQASSLYIGFCKFVNCFAGGAGGAVWFDSPLAGSDPSLIITDSRFENCGSNDDGGAIYARNTSTVQASHVQILDSTFVGNSADNGGAVCVPGFRSDVTVTGCTFRQNHGLYNGGAVNLRRIEGQGVLSGGTFRENTCNSSAGGLYCEGQVLGDPGTIVVSDCEFTGNQAKSNGALSTGLVSHTRELVRVENSRFLDNTATSGNGAAYVASGSQVVGCTFTGNSAASDCGAARIRGSMAGCTFTGNSAGDDGGAVVLDAGGVLDTSVLTGNQAGLWGGAVWITWKAATDPPALVSACEMQNNTAKGGGAIKADSGVIRNCLVIRENIASEHKGGGIVADNASILNCIITQNQAAASWGGGVALLKCLMVDCILEGNSAQSMGGGAYVHTCTLSSCRITDNTAGQGGGVWCKDTEFVACTVEGNTPDNCDCYDSEDCCEGW